MEAPLEGAVWAQRLGLVRQILLSCLTKGAKDRKIAVRHWPGAVTGLSEGLKEAGQLHIGRPLDVVRIAVAH